jgi:lysophospholipase L1-like esterase
MIRQEYGSRAGLFDIAALEQQTPARAGVPYLAAAYSSDGAHLNDAGRRVVAAGLVKSLAAVSSRVDAGTR